MKGDKNMQVTKEIYEKVVKECNGDLDLAHEVVLKLYDSRCTCKYPGILIRNFKESVLKKRNEEQEFVNFEESNVMEAILSEHIKNCFLELERKQLKESINVILQKIILDEGKPQRNVEIIIERFMNEKTLKYISDEFGISQETVRNVIFKYLRMLRQPSRAKYIKDFMFDSYLYL